MPKTINVPRPADGEVLYDVEEKVFEDIRANPGEQAYVFIHTVPYEGSVALVNLLTATWPSTTRSRPSSRKGRRSTPAGSPWAPSTASGKTT